MKTLTIIGVPLFAVSLLAVDAVSPLASHAALGLLAGVLSVVSVSLLRAEAARKGD